MVVPHDEVEILWDVNLCQKKEKGEEKEEGRDEVYY